MFTTKAEETFFLNTIKSQHCVLEYGSGESTHQISKLCKCLVSVEHDKPWYDQVIKTIPQNCTLLFVPPDTPYKQGSGDGTPQQFKSYAKAPIKHGPYDVIFIDGRSRVFCSELCKDMGHENTIVFIHDFNRPIYAPALNFLQQIDCCGTMAKFKIKL